MAVGYSRRNWRYLVRDALCEAIEQLRQVKEVEEAIRETLHVEKLKRFRVVSPTLSKIRKGWGSRFWSEDKKSKSVGWASPPKPDDAKMKKNQTYRTTFNEYTVGQSIGNGGSGIVYEALNKDSERFALKVIDPKYVTTQKLKRFQNEIKFSENITHRNIIKVLDHGPGESGAPFYVMPMFECTLEKVMAEHILPNAILPIFSQILDGVEAAHLKNVTHRDLKPKNILCDREGATFVVADFGIASFEDEELYTAVETRDGDRLANFYYAAPEQKVRGAVVGPAADVFALGLILNEMFTHSIPQGTNFKTISLIAPEFSFLDRLVDEMARNEPAERPDIRTVKQKLIAYQQDFVSHQKINQLTNEVVSEESIDDDILIREPVVVVGVQFEPPRELHVCVNHAPNMPWQQEFFKQGNYSSFVDGPKPASVAFYGSRALVNGVRPDNAQMYLDYFKQWLQNGNDLYKAKVELDARNRVINERKAVEQNLETERLKQNVTSKLKW